MCALCVKFYQVHKLTEKAFSLFPLRSHEVGLSYDQVIWSYPRSIFKIILK